MSDISSSSSAASAPEPTVTLTGDVAADAKSAGEQEIDAAKAAGKAILETTAGAVASLFAIAAGDEHVLLTEAEAAAIPFLVHFVPAPYQGAVGAFAAMAASKVDGPLTTTVDSGVKEGLAIASAAILAVLASAEKALS